MQFIVNITMPGVKPTVPCHLEIFFGDMLDKQFYKINGWKSFFNKNVVLMSVVMESHVITVIGINSGKSNNRTAKVTADVLDNGFRITEIRFCINIKSIFVFLIYIRLYLFEGGTNPFFEFIQQDSLKRLTEVRIVEVFYIAPESVVRISAFGKKTVDVRVPFERTAESMKDTDKARDKIFGFVQGEKEFFDDIRNSLKEAVKQVAVFQKEMPKGLVDREDKMSVRTID